MSRAEELETKALSVPDQAEGLTIETAKQFLHAGEFLRNIKALRGEIDDAFDPIIKKAHEAHKEAIDQKKKVEAPLVRAELIVKPKIAIYLQEEERKRQEAELLAQKKAWDEAEHQQLVEASLLNELGETDLANAKLAEPPVVPTVILPRSVPPAPGISMRQNWSAKVTDLQALVKAVAEFKVPIQAILANQTFLNQQARAMKNALNYPGVRAVADNNVSARR